MSEKAKPPALVTNLIDAMNDLELTPGEKLAFIKLLEDTADTPRTKNLLAALDVKSSPPSTKTPTVAKVK